MGISVGDDTCPCLVSHHHSLLAQHGACTLVVGVCQEQMILFYLQSRMRVRNDHAWHMAGCDVGSSSIGDAQNVPRQWPLCWQKKTLCGELGHYMAYSVVNHISKNYLKHNIKKTRQFALPVFF